MGVPRPGEVHIFRIDFKGGSPQCECNTRACDTSIPACVHAPLTAPQWGLRGYFTGPPCRRPLRVSSQPSGRSHDERPPLHGRPHASAEPSRLYALRRALARPSARRTARWPRYSTTLWSICANMSRTVDCSQRTAATPPATRAAPELARVRERWAQVAKAACWTGASDCACLVGARADATRKATVTRAKAGRSLAGWQS